MWNAYILRCKDGTYTRIRIPVALVYQEEHPDRPSAQKREAQIKRWTRAKKEALISRNIKSLHQLSKSRD